MQSRLQWVHIKASGYKVFKLKLVEIQISICEIEANDTRAAPLSIKASNT